MTELAHIAAVIIGMAAVIKLAYGQLKLHLKEEFATKHDLKRMEYKLDRVLGIKPVTRVRFAPRQESVDDNA